VTKHISSTQLVIFVILPVIISWACSRKQEGWQGTLEEVDGIVVVHNPKTPIHTDFVLELKEDLKIGEAEGPEDYMFTNIRDLAVDDDGNIYAADYEDACIKVYNRVGEFVRRISQKGQGPGELGRPYGVQIINNQEVMVHDGANRRVHYFSREGDFLRDVAFGKLWHLDCLSDGREFYYAMVMLREEDFSGFKLMQLDRELQEIQTFFEWPMSYEPDLPIRMHSPGLSFGIMSDGYLILGWSEHYELKVYNPDGSLRTHVFRDYDPIPVTTDDKEKIEQEIARQPNDLISPRERIFPDHYPAFRNFLPDDEGRIIVQTYEKSGNDTDYICDVFNTEGQFLGSFPFHIMPLVWKADKVYTIEEDEEGFHIVKRYSVAYLTGVGPA
jgi:hypothetical protein